MIAVAYWFISCKGFVVYHVPFYKLVSIRFIFHCNGQSNSKIYNAKRQKRSKKISFNLMNMALKLLSNMDLIPYSSVESSSII